MGSHNSKYLKFENDTYIINNHLCKIELIHRIDNRDEFLIFTLNNDLNVITYQYNAKNNSNNLNYVDVEIVDNDNVQLKHKYITYGIKYDMTMLINRKNMLIRPTVEQHNYGHIIFLKKLLTENKLSPQQSENLKKYIKIVSIITNDFEK